ncbi:MAG: PrpF protein [Frankiales bacterium]|jgi:2-methylaconitate cis-trans-isomerase PrpF|nr:PrpF protein [Frankiales bacterium]
MGFPTPREIHGMGGGHPLSSKIAGRAEVSDVRNSVARGIASGYEN